jgi:DNA polymerase III delta prime subunit
MLNQVWCEKYRPKSVNKIILSDEKVKKQFNQFLISENIPNILMFGGPGTGKTSMSQALIKDLNINRLDVLRINCSDEKIDALRDKVKGFANTMPLGKFKIVRLEEFDYLNHEAQALLRSLIEDVSDSCRFIATCNYINKVTPPLRSRFQEFQMMSPDKDDVIVLAAEILEAEKIEFDITSIEKIIAVSYPDVRKMIQLLESNTVNNKLCLSNESSIVDWKLQLLPLLESSKFLQARKIVCESATQQELIDIFRFLFDNIHRAQLLVQHGYHDDAIILIAKYQYQHAFVSDPEINIAALFCELERFNK